MSKVNLTPPRVLDVVGHKTNNGVKSVETTRWVVSKPDLTPPAPLL
ncbi:MAG: hypothetical protein UZ05_CHB002000689 [Chlorobi bacterium OLB5]|nr:MAG: hypothetical protein UZ05_CHB002000689 [Chlorobi bacterium OLB5]